MTTMDTRTTMGMDMGIATTEKTITITLSRITTRCTKRKVVPTADDSSLR